LYSRGVALKRMDNVGVVVDDLGETIDLFRELGLELEGRATIEGEWAGRVTGLADQRVEIAMMRTPDSHSYLELSRSSRRLSSRLSRPARHAHNGCRPTRFVCIG
jgi:hypothetical protein